MAYRTLDHLRPDQIIEARGLLEVPDEGLVIGEMRSVAGLSERGKQHLGGIPVETGVEGDAGK